MVQDNCKAELECVEVMLYMYDSQALYRELFTMA